MNALQRTHHRPRGLSIPLVVALVGLLGGSIGCKAGYYATAEAFGAHKRDLLVDRIKDARDAQENARDQFDRTVKRFHAVTEAEPGNLQRRFNQLESQLSRTRSRADAVHARMTSVEQVAADLFAEWRQELEQFSDPTLRASSEQSLAETESRYEAMFAVMHDARSKMTPVLQVLEDQTLRLKHELNATSAASMKDTARELDVEVRHLLAELDRAIKEANSFIARMGIDS